MYKDILKNCEIDFDAFCIHHDIDYSIAYDELDYYPRGYTFKKDNGKYHIVLNGKHNIEQLKRTAIHELTHVINNHLGQAKPLIDICEHEAEFIVNKLNFALYK